jgi:hypothetical protein
MTKFLLFALKAVGFIFWVAGFFGVLAGIYGLFHHNIGDNRAPILLIFGLLLIAVGLATIYFAVKKDRKELLGVLFNDWFISLLWPW